MLYCVKNHAVAYKLSGLKIFHAKLRSIFFTWISIRLLLFSCATYRICYRYELSSAIVKAVLHHFYVPSYIAKSWQKLISKGIVNDPIRWQTFKFTVKLSTMHGHLGDRRKWVLWRGGHYRDVGVSYENSF